MRHIWLTYIRPILWPWYLERDPDEGFRRWLRETGNGQAGYRRFRSTVQQCNPDAATDMPERLGYK